MRAPIAMRYGSRSLAWIAMDGLVLALVACICRLAAPRQSEHRQTTHCSCCSEQFYHDFSCSVSVCRHDSIRLPHELLFESRPICWHGHLLFMSTLSRIARVAITPSLFQRWPQQADN